MQCEYCKSTFKTERGFQKHSCEKKRIAESLGGVGLLAAFDLYDFWHRYNGFARKSKPRSMDEFTKSPYFRDFTGLQKFMLERTTPPGREYIVWLSEQRIPVKQWTKESVLKRFITAHERGDNVMDLVMDSLNRMALWCDERELDITDFFEIMTPGDGIKWLASGKISPWVFLLSSKADVLMDKFSDEQLEYVTRIIDPAYWESRFQVSKAQVEEVKEILEEIGL